MSTTGLFGANPSSGPTSTSVVMPAPAATPNSVKHEPCAEIPAYDELFSYISIHSSTRGYLTRLAALSDVPSSGATDALIGQQLISHVSLNKNDSKENKGDILLQCNPLSDFPSSKQKIFAPADQALRERLRSKPYITLQGKLTGMTPQILDEIFTLADDLQISELSAISLYSEASDARTRKWLEGRLATNFYDSASASVEAFHNGLAPKEKKAKKAKYEQGRNGPVKFGNDVPTAARELFFHERSCLLSTLLILIKERIAAIDQLLQYDQDSNNLLPPSHAVIVATDELLQNKLIPNLINCIKSLTKFSNEKIRDINSSKKNYTAAMNANGAMFYGQSSTATNQIKRKEKSDMVLMSFALSQRQRATECLFYLLYQTQVMGDELTDIVDLVKELSNGDQLRVLDALKDVPSLQEEYFGQQQNEQNRQSYSWDKSKNMIANRDPNSTFQEKSSMEWESELIQDLWNQGKPQLMHCVSVLSLTTICALDCSQLLFDRTIHGPNKFGQGNALLPPEHAGLAPNNFLDNVHSLLDINSSSSQWHRKDIWGLLCAAYALLLESHANISNATNDPLFSPGVRGTFATSSSTNFDVKATFHSCLETATNNKAFTFARKCIIPSIFSSSTTALYQSDHESDGTNFEFYCRVLAEFTNSYLETIAKFGEMPISREKWQIEEEEELHLRRLHHEQRMQFGIAPSSSIDNANFGQIEFSKRPDCMDDLIALVVEICSTCPPCSILFWYKDEGDEVDDEDVIRLRPSFALIKMESLQKEDNSLLPAYLSLLSVLSLAGIDDSYTVAINGANMVNSILSQNDHNSIITWSYLLNALQWYADQLSTQTPVKKGTISTSFASSNLNISSTIDDSSSYYYGANDEENLESKSSSFAYNAPPQQAKNNISNNHESVGTSTLGESNTLAILSMLAIIARASLLCENSRKSINSLHIPTSTGEEKENDAITILFRLLSTSLSSKIKGEVFNTIAALVKDDEEKATKAWELLEVTQVLPTIFLGQYTHGLQGVNNLSIPTNPRNFASSRHVSNNNEVFATSERYGILYEMEHIESSSGSYFATEGFLFLISTLISCTGIKPNLGASFRRPGISPYIEFIVFFVIPRIFTPKEMNKVFAPVSKCRPLFFASSVDRYRLITRVLEVIALILSSYAVPPPPRERFSSQSQIPESPTLESFQRFHQEMTQAADNLGLTIDDDILDISDEKKVNFEDLETYIRDFREESVTIPTSSSNIHQRKSNGTLLVPRPKSPGFSLLSDLLGGGHLLQSILITLVENNGANGIRGSAEAIRAKIQSFTLFLDAPPSFTQYKKRWYNKASTASLSTLTPPVLYALTRNKSKKSMSFCSPDDPILWREQTIAQSLRILCSVAAREESFSRLVNASDVPLIIVPVLHFGNNQRSSIQHSGLFSYNVSISRLSNTLVTAAGSPPFSSMINVEPLPIIAQYVRYNSQHDELAKRAVGIVSFITENISSKIGVPALCGKVQGGSERLAESFAHKLLSSSSSTKTRMNIHGWNTNAIISDNEEMNKKRDGVRGAILDLILSNLSYATPSLSRVLLGLQIDPHFLRQSPGNPNGSLNCLDAILHLLSNESFLLNPESASLAARCYHIIYCLCSCKSGTDNSVATFFKLRQENFWLSQCKKYFSKPSSSKDSQSTFEIVCNTRGAILDQRMKQRNSEALHAFAWFLKCVALELHSLRGIDSYHNSFKNPFKPQPTQCKRLLEILLGASTSNSVVHSIMTSLPLHANKDLSGTAHPPPREVIKAAKCPLLGPYEIFDKYEAVDLRILLASMQNGSEEDKVAALRWGQNWNNYISYVCSISHVASAWEFLISTVAMCSNSFVMKGYLEAANDQRTCYALNHSQIIRMIQSILHRVDANASLVAYSSHDFNFHGLDTLKRNGTSNFEVESSCALSLCMAVIPLVHLLVSVDFCEAEIENNVADIATLSMVLASCISSCADAGPAHDERAVILSSALTAILHWMELYKPRDSTLPFKNKNWKVSFVNAAIHLSRLSVNNKEQSKNQDIKKSNSIALSAREAFSSIIRFFGVSLDSSSFSWEDENDDMSSFLLRVFDGDDGVKRMSDLIGLVKTLEMDISWMLLSIVQCKYGVEILLQAGLPAALLTVNANHYNSSIERESYGSIEINPPKHLYGHIILLSTMLCVQEDNSLLAAEAAKFIRHNLSTIQLLLRTYPRNGDLTEKILSLLSLVTSKLKIGVPNAYQSSMHNENLIESVFGKDLSIIERRVEDYIHHISTHPFPIQFLSPLPKRLVDLEQAKLDTHLVSGELSWWDRLPQVASQSTIYLADPPLTSNSSMSGDTLFGTFEKPNVNAWTDEKYQFAISAASSLIHALAFVTNRIRSSRNTVLSFDAILFAKGLYRCADAANAINEHLVSSSTKIDRNTLANQTQHAKAIELDALSTLGPILGQCAQSILIVSSLHLESLVKVRNSSNGKSLEFTTRLIQDFAAALLVVLDQLNIDELGVGCLQAQNACKKMARSLRDQMENMKL